MSDPYDDDDDFGGPVDIDDAVLGDDDTEILESLADEFPVEEDMGGIEEPAEEEKDKQK